MDNLRSTLALSDKTKAVLWEVGKGIISVAASGGVVYLKTQDPVAAGIAAASALLSLLGKSPLDASASAPKA